MNDFTLGCKHCLRMTSRKYAREHNGLCKLCAEPEVALLERRPERTREQRILEHGWQAYAREEGHYE